MKTTKDFHVLEVRPRLQPEDDPIAWLLVQRDETYTYNYESKLQEASLSISYKCITKSPLNGLSGHGSFGGSFRASDNKASITTSSTSGGGAVFLDPTGLQGQRVGTYLMNEVVLWVQQWPEAEVKPIKLNAGQATADNHERRNWFYRQFGIHFKWDDLEEKGGLSKSMHVKELTSVESWKQNIKVHQLFEHLATQRYVCDTFMWQVRDREQRIANLAKEIAQARAKPIRWALMQTWIRVSPIMMMLAVLAVAALAIWNGQVTG